jgi:tRNA A37 threonylcarbamoyltransferase TsaD
MEQEMALHFAELIDSGAHVVTFAQYREATTRRMGELIDQAIGARASKLSKKA